MDQYNLNSLELPFLEDRPYEEWEVAIDQSGSVIRNQLWQQWALFEVPTALPIGFYQHPPGTHVSIVHGSHSIEMIISTLVLFLGDGVTVTSTIPASMKPWAVGMWPAMLHVAPSITSSVQHLGNCCGSWSPGDVRDTPAAHPRQGKVQRLSCR